MTVFMQKFGSRKFLFILLLLFMGAGIDFFTTRGLSLNLLELFKWLGGTYVLGNSLSGVGDAISAKNKGIDPSAFHAVLNQVDANLATISATQSQLVESHEQIIGNQQLTNNALTQIAQKR